jgi:hypothetical protein
MVRLRGDAAVIPARFPGAAVLARSPLRRFRHHRRQGVGGLARGSVFGLRVDLAPVIIRRHDEDQGNPDDPEPNQNGNLGATPE